MGMIQVSIIDKIRKIATEQQPPGESEDIVLIREAGITYDVLKEGALK